MSWCAARSKNSSLPITERAASLRPQIAGMATRILGEAQPDLLVGQRFGHYELAERIGRGRDGRGLSGPRHHSGTQSRAQTPACAFYRRRGPPEAISTEARTVVALNHPNILTIYEIGEARSTHYIASELIDGETLRQRFERGPTETEEAVEVAIQVASALVAAHERRQSSIATSSPRTSCSGPTAT